MLCAGYGGAQQQTASVPNRALTYMERNMYACADINGLQTLYNTIQNDYDLRYFLAGLPGFLAERKVTTVPGWAQVVVVNGLSSKDPLVVYNAARTANMLGVNCTMQLMAVYQTVHNTFGSHEDMVKTAILGALSRFDDPNKQNFLYNVLTKDRYPLVSGTFTALLSAMESSPTPLYLPKLAACSDTLDSLAIRGGGLKEHEYIVREFRGVQERINRLKKLIGGN